MTHECGFRPNKAGRFLVVFEEWETNVVTNKNGGFVCGILSEKCLGYCDSMGGICGNYRDNMVLLFYCDNLIWEIISYNPGTHGIKVEFYWIMWDFAGRYTWSIPKKAALKPLT